MAEEDPELERDLLGEDAVIEEDIQMEEGGNGVMVRT